MKSLLITERDVNIIRVTGSEIVLGRIESEKEERPIVGKWCNCVGGAIQRRAFTLVELLVVISIISLLMSILVPVMSRARMQGRRILGISNQRTIVQAINLYAADNDGRYPESIATVGPDDDWSWQEPMKIIGYETRISPRVNRSMSAYLRTYISKGKILHCPSSPRQFNLLEEAWRAGDGWDHPDVPGPTDPLTSTYCFLWSYTGYLEGQPDLFQGPWNDIGGRGQSKLAVCCYFGYDYYSSTNAYGSCERFRGASAVKETQLISGYWADNKRSLRDKPKIKLHAGYVDGHVESYSSSETVTMRVIWEPKTGSPYPKNIGPGEFFLPADAMH